MTPASIPISQLLPHGPEMTLIDALIESSKERSVAVVEITEHSEFLEAGGVPAWVGIEYMAQTIAARIGYGAQQDGELPPVGFLLGSRSYRGFVTEFALGSRLQITVEPLFVESGFGTFTCTIAMEEVLAQAVLNTYQPSKQFLENMEGE